MTITLPPSPSHPTTLASRPSPATARAAQSAASSKHGLLNLTRLIVALDSRVPNLEVGTSQSASVALSWVELERTWETILYAQALIEALRNGNEESSTTSRDLDSLSGTLISIQTRVQHLSAIQRPTSPFKPTLFSMPSNSQMAPPSLLEHALTTAPSEPISLPSGPSPSPSTIQLSPTAQTVKPIAASLHKSLPTLSRVSPPSRASTIRRRNAPDVAEYLRAIAIEDLKGGEAGLLPIRSRPNAIGTSAPKVTVGSREQLLGTQSGSVGSAQLHEELGGQLVGMSHQLRMNAVHFASSLEEEKALLNSSQDVLEKNLTATRSSKAQLSKVSSKGRGTTCLTLGVVVLVLVLFIWTYLLIRFT